MQTSPTPALAPAPTYDRAVVVVVVVVVVIAAVVAITIADTIAVAATAVVTRAVDALVVLVAPGKRISRIRLQEGYRLECS